jgi:glycosyltransferase involved in cell wall biosynthesis
MNILQLVQKPQRRGAEVFAYQLSQALRSRGQSVHITYLYPWTGVGALPLAPADTCLDGREDHLFEKLPGVHAGLLRRLLRVIDATQPDVVQVNGARTVKYGAFAAMARPRRSWALIYRNIGNPQDWITTWYHRTFYARLVMPRLDGAVGVSQVTLDNLQAVYRLDIPARPIPNGVATDVDVSIGRQELRQRLNTPPDAPVLLFVGSFSAEKRVDRLLRLVQEVRGRRPNLHAWLVGDGPLRRELQAQATALGLEDAVRFVGVQTDVASYFAAADLFVLTSDTEGIPAVLLEAGLLGLPVVATNVGGVPEAVVDGETGLLVSPEHEEALAQAVLALLDDPAGSQAMGEKATRWVSEHFSTEKIAVQYLAFYEEVLSPRRQ